MQSSGFGKSRLVRELGKDVTSGAPSFFVFAIHLRPQSGGPGAGYPPGDHAAFEFFNENLCSHSTLAVVDKARRQTYTAQLCELKGTTFLASFYRKAADVLEASSEAAMHQAWQKFADPSDAQGQQNGFRLAESSQTRAGRSSLVLFHSLYLKLVGQIKT